MEKRDEGGAGDSPMFPPQQVMSASANPPSQTGNAQPPYTGIAGTGAYPPPQPDTMSVQPPYAGTYQPNNTNNTVFTQPPNYGPAYPPPPPPSAPMEPPPPAYDAIFDPVPPGESNSGAPAQSACLIVDITHFQNWSLIVLHLTTSPLKSATQCNQHQPNLQRATLVQRAFCPGTFFNQASSMRWCSHLHRQV